MFFHDRKSIINQSIVKERISVVENREEEGFTAVYRHARLALRKIECIIYRRSRYLLIFKFLYWSPLFAKFVQNVIHESNIFIDCRENIVEGKF